MVTNHILLRFIFLTISTMFFAQGSIAAIYRPAAGPSTLANNLLFDIIIANSTPDDDIIDLGGNIYVYNESCDQNATAVIPTLAPPNIQDYCTTTDGLNAFPPIATASTGGKLSIINGTIQRMLPASLTPPYNYFRFFDVLSGADFTLFNITLEYGNVNDSSAVGGSGSGMGTTNSGGAIYNQGNLKLQNSALLGNTANDLGGAIYNSSSGDSLSTLDIQRSSISNNIAMDASAGYGGGGGIYNDANSIIDSIDNSTISNNITLGYGAGINNQGAANNIFGSTISDNFCCIPVPGGICPEPPTGSGGGIYNDGGASLLYLSNSTIYGNTAYQGGGIYNNYATEDLSNTKFIGKTLQIANGVYLYNNTITRNIANAGGGGIYNNNNSNVGGPAIITDLFSNIVAGNIDTNEFSIATPDIQNFDDDGTTDAIITNWGNNLVGNNYGVDGHITLGDIQNDISGTPAAPLDPLLEHLKYNGGFTRTVALLPGSPAINNGLNPLSLLYDQRGKPFYRVVCGRPDIGSYELQDCLANTSLIY
jgi:hypothetical protein